MTIKERINQDLASKDDDVQGKRILMDTVIGAKGDPKTYESRRRLYVLRLGFSIN
jgi:hypothetical protein